MDLLTCFTVSHTHTHTHPLLSYRCAPLHIFSPFPSRLTDADALIIQFGRGVAVESQSAVLAVLAPGVVLAADACDDVQVVDVAAAIGVAVALAVWKKKWWISNFFSGVGKKKIHEWNGIEGGGCCSLGGVFGWHKEMINELSLYKMSESFTFRCQWRNKWCRVCFMAFLSHSILVQ